MNTRTKSILKSSLILASVLILGMLIGGMLTGAVVRERLQVARDFQTSAGFVHHTERLIAPESEAQRAEIRMVLKRSGAKAELAFERGREELALILDHMERDLEPVLTAEQMERLRARRSQLRRRFRD